MNYLVFVSTISVAIAQQLHYGDVDCSKQVIPVYGAGSESAFGAYQTIGSSYVGNRVGKRTIDFAYSRKNSLGGINLMMSTNIQNRTIFAASEITFNDTEKEKYTRLIHVPILAEALTILFNLPNTDKLNLTVTAVAEIFLGNIQRWNHFTIQALNPGVVLPNEKILLVVRQDVGAGETFVFTKGLSETSPDWKKKYGIFTDPAFLDGKCCNSTKWPDVITYFGNTANGLTGVLSSIPYTMGYASLSNALLSGTVQASLYNNANVLIKPSVKGVQSAISYTYSVEVEGSGNPKALSDFDLINANNNDSYSLPTFSFIILNRTTSPDVSCCSMEELVGLIDTLISPESEEVLTRNNLVPLPQHVAKYIRTSILPTITCKGESVYANYVASLTTPIDRSLPAWELILIVLGIATAIFSVCMILFIRYTRTKLLYESTWVIDGSEFKGVEGSGASTTSLPRDSGTTKGFWSKNDCMVYLTMLHFSHSSRWKRKTKQLMNTFYREFQHQNLVNILGVTFANSFSQMVRPYYPKGTLHRCLANSPYEISVEMKYCLAADVVEGILYLHKKYIAHGFLSSINCYVDTNWTVKLAGWEVLTLYFEEDLYQLQNLLAVKFSKGTTESASDIVRLLYKDPYLGSLALRTPYHSDVYSMGALLIELFTQKLPYFFDVTETFTFEDIIREKFSRNSFIPTINPDSVPEAVNSLVLNCLKAPKERPEMVLVQATLNHGRPLNKSVIDIAMETMERTMINLSKMTNRMEELLNAMLPPQIATKLFNGETVEPEFYESCTIFFSDIVGFTNISSRSTPYEVMSFLNNIWLLFDNTLSKYDVYKVDTIGDAYMVASGLPNRNGVKHCKYIADLSLELMNAVEQLEIAHLDNERISMRMGFNSGAVTAGVIGYKMPQYCVFGDAVNTASRMESTSLPHRIQTSETAYELLTTHYNEFEMVYRGEIEVKGKGQMKTYWLNGKAYHKRIPARNC